MAVVYWSQSGTEAMANAIAEIAGTDAIEVSSFSAGSVTDYDAFAFGCPRHGRRGAWIRTSRRSGVTAGPGDSPSHSPRQLRLGHGRVDGRLQRTLPSSGVNVSYTVIANLGRTTRPLGAPQEAGREASA